MRLNHDAVEQAGFHDLLPLLSDGWPHRHVEIAAQKHCTHLPHLRLWHGAGELEELRHKDGRVRLVLREELLGLLSYIVVRIQELRDHFGEAGHPLRTESAQGTFPRQRRARFPGRHTMARVEIRRGAAYRGVDQMRKGSERHDTECRGSTWGTGWHRGSGRGQSGATATRLARLQLRQRQRKPFPDFRGLSRTEGLSPFW